jgi:hypothetical protein
MVEKKIMKLFVFKKNHIIVLLSLTEVGRATKANQFKTFTSKQNTPKA